MNNKRKITTADSTHQEDDFIIAHRELIESIKALEKRLVDMELYEIAAECRYVEKKVKEIKKIMESMN